MCMYAKTVFVHRKRLLMGFDRPLLMGCGLGRGSGPIDGLCRGLVKEMIEEDE